MGNTLGFLPLPPLLLSPAAHVVGDVCGYLPEPEDPVPVTDQALTSVPVGFLIPHQDARGSPSWWMMLSPRDNLSTQLCPLDCNTLLSLSQLFHEWKGLPGVSPWVLRTVQFCYTLQFCRSLVRETGLSLST